MVANPIAGTGVFLLGGVAAAAPSTVLRSFGFGEWKGTSCRTRVLLSSGVVILAFGFAVMAAGGR